MKKFFALMLVVLMLAFASSAMAAVTLTATPSPVNVTAGSTATVTLMAGGIEENLGPAWSFDLRNNPPSWVTLNGTDGTSRTRTLTLTPGATVTANTYTITVRVRGSYKPSVHGARVTQTQSADISVVVAAAAPASDTVPQPKTEIVTVEETVADVPVISEASVSNATFADITEPPSVQVQAGIASNDTAITADLGSLSGTTIPAGTPVGSPDNLVEVEESEAEKRLTPRQKYESKAGKFKKQNFTPRTPGGKLLTTGDLPKIKVTKAAKQPIKMPKYDAAFYRTHPILALLKTVLGVGSAELKAAAASNGNEAVFLDSNGKLTDIIPGEKTVSTDPEPGVLTAIAYLEPGIEYEPIAAVEVPASMIATVDAAAGTTTKAVTVVTEEVITVYESRTFSPVVEESAIIAVASARGIASKDLKLFDTTVAEGSSWDVSAAESAYMLANDIDEVAKLPRLKNVEAGTYIAKISFDNTPRDAQTYGAPTLYPYGVKANGAATDATVYAISNNQAYEVPGSAIYDGMNAYLVVTVGTNGVAVADTDVNAAVSTIDRPTIAVKLNNVIGVGSSSGGCSAGSAVLALALLGTFIAARKK